MAIGLAILAAFPVFANLRQGIQDWLLTNFVPAVGHVVEEQVSHFVSNAGRLSAAGIVGLAVSAIMLLVTVETALNGIFRVARPRSALSRILVYWTMMTLGPMLLGASVSVQGYLATLSVWKANRTFVDHLATPLPTLLTIATFTVMYAAIPNRQVPAKDAFIGGIVSGLMSTALRSIFALYVANTGSYSTVYGAVAAVPIVLVWMFLSWVVVLIGAEVTAALAEWRAGYGIHVRSATGERRLAIALEVLSVLYVALRAGHGGIGLRALMTAATAGEAEVVGVLRHLQIHGFVAPTTNRRFLLGRDLTDVTLGQTIHALDLGLGLDDRVAPDAAWRARALPLIDDARKGMHTTLDITLAELFQDHSAPAST